MVVSSSGFSSPSVSICIPTFNGAAYIRECVESALAQTFSNVEVIIADDASTDDTTAIATQLASVDSRVRVSCNTTNLGLVRNWNRAIGLATGAWVKLLFQDDLLDPQYLEELLAIVSGA